MRGRWTRPRDCSSLPNVGGATGKVAGQVGVLAEEILAAALANRENLTALVRNEVDLAVSRLGLVPTSELERARDEVARLRAEVSRLREATAAAAAAPAAASAVRRPRRPARPPRRPGRRVRRQGRSATCGGEGGIRAADGGRPRRSQGGSGDLERGTRWR